MLKTNRIHKTYQVGFLRQKKKPALNGVTLHVKRNEVFGIVGLNGAGKSSLLKVFMGFIRQDSGSVDVSGTPGSIASTHDLIGYLPENPSLYPHLSITEHLLFSCKISHLTEQETKNRITSVIEKVGLTDHAKTSIKRFSKGMTQRAALAYAILLEPEILILDEPMSGLDPLGRQLVIDIIQEYQKKGTTILFCSHILTDVERICDRIGIMHNGNLATILETPIKHSLPNGSFFSGEGKTPLESLFLHTVQS